METETLLWAYAALIALVVVFVTRRRDPAWLRLVAAVVIAFAVPLGLRLAGFVFGPDSPAAPHPLTVAFLFVFGLYGLGFGLAARLVLYLAGRR